MSSGSQAGKGGRQLVQRKAVLSIVAAILALTFGVSAGTALSGPARSKSRSSRTASR